jgi:hypothetical protein
MKKYIPLLFEISLVILGFVTLLLLGAEPSGSEQSYYDYEHFTDKGHFGWYLCWIWVGSGIITLTTFIMLVIDSNKKLTK